MDEIERLLCAVLASCAFQDLTGQRLDKIERSLTGAPSRDDDVLLNGPSLKGAGLDQSEADALFAESPSSSSPS